MTIVRFVGVKKDSVGVCQGRRNPIHQLLHTCPIWSFPQRSRVRFAGGQFACGQLKVQWLWLVYQGGLAPLHKQSSAGIESSHWLVHRRLHTQLIFSSFSNGECFH